MLSSRWRGLTQPQRDSWNTAATSFPYQDSLNETRYLSGSALYIKLNSALLMTLNPINDSAPVYFDTPFISYPSMAVNRDLTPAVPGQDMVFTDFSFSYAYTDALSGDYSVVTEVTPGLSAGISNAGTKYRVLTAYTILPSDGEGVFDINTVVQPAYNTQFGPQPVGTKIFFRISLVNNTSGQRSQLISGSALVGVTP